MMIKAALFIFLVIPLVFSSSLLLVLFFMHSTLFKVSEKVSMPEKKAEDYYQPVLSRFELNRIVSQVRRFDRERTHLRSSRPVYYYL